MILYPSFSTSTYDNGYQTWKCDICHIHREGGTAELSEHVATNEHIQNEFDCLLAEMFVAKKNAAGFAKKHNLDLPKNF